MPRALEGTDTERVYRFIKHYIEERGGLAPSQREIAKACYISRSSVQRHLDILEARGLVVRELGIARGLTLPRKEET